MTDTNKPKVLVELSPEQLTWLADRLHEEWARSVSARAVVSSDDLVKKVQDNKQMAIDIMLLLDKNSNDQGFGSL